MDPPRTKSSQQGVQRRGSKALTLGDMDPPPTQIAQLAARQHGHVTRTQLLGLGLTPPAIKSRRRRGLLISVHDGVYAVGYRRRDRTASAMAAVLACGPGALLSHESAAALWGWRRWPTAAEVSVQGDRRPRGIRVHRTRTLRRNDRTRQLGIPVTAPERTLRDIRPRLTTPQFRRAVSEAAFARLIADPAIARLLGDGPRPTRSTLQDRFQVEIVDAFGLPQPLTDTIVNGYEVDVAWPLQRVLVELDGRDAHAHELAFVADRERDAVQIDHGWIPIRLATEQLDLRAAVIARRLLALLQRRTPHP